MDTMPAPVVATPPLYQLVDRLVGPANIGVLNDRRIVHSIDLHTVGDTTTQLQLSVSHSKESRRFNAVLAVVGVVDHGTYTVTVSLPRDRTRARRLPSKDVSRYSATALMAFRSETAVMLMSDPTWVDLDLSPWGPED